MNTSDKTGAENANWNALERRTGRKSRRKKRSGRYKGRSRRIRRVRKIKQAGKPLLAVVGICLLVSLLITYLTGNLHSLIEKIIKKNIEKTIQRTLGISGEQNADLTKLRSMGKNIDLNKIKSEALKTLGGWEGDRGENQTTDEHKEIIQRTFGGGSNWGDRKSGEQE